MYTGTWQAARGTVRAHGLPGLYKGLTPTLVEIVPYAAMQFGFYDLFKRAATSWQRGRDGPATPAANFTCGLAAGVLAKFLTHPMDVAKKRFQVAGLQRSLDYGARISANQYRGERGRGGRGGVGAADDRPTDSFLRFA